MAKIRYQFNTKSLKIEKVQVSFRERLRRWLFSLAFGLVFGVIVIVLAYNFVSSPRERILKNEVEQYKLNYKILNDRLKNLQTVLDDLQDRDDNIYRVIFEAEPVPASMRKAGYGGADRYSKLSGVSNSDIIVSTTKKLDEITGQMYVQSKSFDDVFKMAKNKEKVIASIPAIQPVDFHDLRRIGSYFGYRTDPFYKVTKFHEGIDFAAAVGTPVYATGDGVVTEAEFNRGGYGMCIKINHGYSYETFYAHLSSMKVRIGQKITRGMIIGAVGNTGKSTAPHLHYEVHKGGNPINPIYFFFNDITPKEYQAMIEQSSKPSQTLD
ncbi:MAG: M23 family metallopeptidase [Bacteroidetes bacterium]|nr:M23 family metallopeptidase [Bacteroidota bacterium]